MNMSVAFCKKYLLLNRKYEGSEGMNCLLIDFGSTYTKVTAVDVTKQQLLGTAKSRTTVEGDIKEGYHQAKEKLLEAIQLTEKDFEKQFACSSAHGGFKMVAVGLTDSLTTEAAKRAALGAGTRILKVYSYGLSEENVAEINGLKPDVILLSGGTDHGNERNILLDAEQLTHLTHDIPIVVAGNIEVYPKIKAIFEKNGQSAIFTENVMPKVNVLNADPVRKILRELFMSKIVEAKGLKEVSKWLDGDILPTPASVLQAAELLSQGSEQEQGIGELLVVDIGGATTDIHSIGSGAPVDVDIRVEGLQEPFLKRTVEGDLGMRYSAYSLYESVGAEAIQNGLAESVDVEENCRIRSLKTEMIPKTQAEIDFDEAMAKAAVAAAVGRHAGHMRKEPTPTRTLYYQSGKDLGTFHHILGTGGVLVHSDNPAAILQASLREKEDSLLLKPTTAQYYIDEAYFLSAMGILAQLYPDAALKIMKKTMKRC